MKTTNSMNLKNRNVLLVKKAKIAEEPEQEKKKVDKGIEGRTDRAEDMIRLIGNCFKNEQREVCVESIDRIESALGRLRRKFKSQWGEKIL